MFKFSAVVATGLVLASTLAAEAADPVKVGMVLTLSGPPAAIGQQIRNGFELALDQMGGQLGGRPVELIVQDDELKPDVAVTKANALVERDNVDFVVGPVFSNILQAIIKPITKSGTILISPNPGTSDFAGKGCNPNFFVASIQNDQAPKALGDYANAHGIDKIVAITPNYQAGRDMVNGFKRSYKGELIDEIYVPLNQMDFSAELTRLAVQQVPAIFTFLPGGMGINFVKQFNQAGLSDKVAVLSMFTADEVTLPAQKEAALGMLGGSHWAPDLDNAENKQFVDAYIKTFDEVPGTFAANAYDIAHMIDAALKQTGGDTADLDALRKALETVEFDSVRGAFKFNTNHYPIQDVIVTGVGQRADGRFQTEYKETIYTNDADPYAGECVMK